MPCQTRMTNLSRGATNAATGRASAARLESAHSKRGGTDAQAMVGVDARAHRHGAARSGACRRAGERDPAGDHGRRFVAVSGQRADRDARGVERRADVGRDPVAGVPGRCDLRLQLDRRRHRPDVHDPALGRGRRDPDAGGREQRRRREPPRARRQRDHPGPAAASAPTATATGVGHPAVISGHTVVGATLKSTPGTWSGAEPITLAYEWMLCRPVCTAIPGATAPALKLTADEVGGAILLMVTASNAGGSTYSYSTGVSTPVGFSVHDLLLQAITPAGKPPTIGRLLKRGRYAVRFDAPHPAVVQIKWTATRTVHGKRRKILVAGATEIVLGPALLNLELTPAGIALLEHARRLNITATATFAVGKRITASATVGFVLTRA